MNKKCTCTWPEGCGPDLKCPVHGCSESSASPAGSMLPDNNELGFRLLDFLRDIHEQRETPESRDVDDLFALISQYID